jgi:predicted ferric reductase
MKQRQGLIFILSALLITAIVWLTNSRIITMDLYGMAFYTLGALSLTGFALVFLLSVRNKRIEKWFNGLEHLYVYHKWLAIFSLSAVMIHAIMKLLYSGGYLSLSGKIGIASEIGFVALMLIALFGKRLKYENWRLFHRLMLIPFVIGAYHMVIGSPFTMFSLSFVSVWMGLVVLVGASSSLYMLLFYRIIAFNHKGKITEIHSLSDSSIEMEITLNKAMDLKEGQYAFLRIFQKGLESAPHPFSISGKDGNKLFITVKALGDFTTQLVNDLRKDTKVSLDGPYGHMNFNTGKNKQVWVAGGVGITPFISYLRASDPNVQVDLYYSYRGEKEGLYKDFLVQSQRANPNLKVHIYDTSRMKRLSVDEIIADEETTIYMCGPSKMIEPYAIQLKDKYRSTEIIFEAFKFAR